MRLRCAAATRGKARLPRPGAPPDGPAEAAAWPIPGRAADAAPVQALDPLRGDDDLARLPGMNARADTGALVSLGRRLMPDATAIGGFSAAECIAAMRDLGMVAGSIRRHGADPVMALPALGPALADLGRRSGMVARDTVYHYTEWNPQGARRRTYTGDLQEQALQDSVRLCLPPLRAAVDLCRLLRTAGADDRGFGVQAAELAHHIRGCAAAIDLARARVSPEFFARCLRPYFEEITVSGQLLCGPAAAHIPVGLIDLALWASDGGSQSYARFCAESARYNPAPWRRLYTDWAEGPSLVTRVLAAGRAAPDRAAPAARALRDTLRALLVFRGRHLALACRAYREDIRLYPVGSGGGSLALLREVTALTRQNAAWLQPPGQVAGDG